MKVSAIRLWITMGAFLLTASSAAAAPPLVNYQGVLTDSQGSPISGAHDLTFRVYPLSTPQAPVLWEETHSGVPVDDGLFNVILGGTIAFPTALWDEIELWMGIQVDTDPEIDPRMRMTSVPWAMRATVADTAHVAVTQADGDWVVSGDNLYPAVTGNVGIGTTTPVEKLELMGGRMALRRVDIPTQWLEIRDSNYRGARVIGHSEERYKKALQLAAFHDGGGSPGGETWIFFSVGAETDPLHAMAIRETGNVGIGTTEPMRRFEVAGDEETIVRITSTGNYQGSILELVSSDAGTSAPTLGKIHFKDLNDTIRGSIQCYERPAASIPWGVTLYAGAGWLRINENGRVGIGTDTPSETLDVEGTVKCSVLTLTGGSDLAEPFDVSGDETIEAGMVLSIDPATPGALKLSSRAYDRCVAGVVSGAGGVNAGLLMAQDGTRADGSCPIALSGRAYCYATAAGGAIEPGDLLTTSETPGHAMKVTDHARAQGATIGKAMTSLGEGRGLVLMLVNLQ